MADSEGRTWRRARLPTTTPMMYTAKNPEPPNQVVNANTAKPPDTTSSARTPPPPSAPRPKRLSSSASPQPQPSPSKVPQPNCCSSDSITSPALMASAVPPATASAMAMNVSVRYTAIGSFMPDSISSVAATRSFRCTPEDFSSENTAAASVEPTMAPTSKASGQDKSSSQCAAAPVMAVHTTTPTVANSSEGRKPVRNVLMSVRRPPSSKITASATLPTQKLRRKSLNTKPPGPSTPASVPTTRNTSRKENPMRAENTPASTLMKTSAAAASKGRVRKSRERFIPVS